MHDWFVIILVSPLMQTAAIRTCMSPSPILLLSADFTQGINNGKGLVPLLHRQVTNYNQL